jgi:hypothetical protein
VSTRINITHLDPSPQTWIWWSYSSGLWRRVDLWLVTKFSGERGRIAASSCNIFLWAVGNHLQDYMVSQPRRSGSIVIRNVCRPPMEQLTHAWQYASILLITILLYPIVHTVIIIWINQWQCFNQYIHLAVWWHVLVYCRNNLIRHW